MRKSNCLFSKLKSRILLALTVFALAFAVAGCDSPAGTGGTKQIPLVAAVDAELGNHIGTWENDDYNYHSEYGISKNKITDAMGCIFNVVSSSLVTSADGYTLIFCQCANGTQYTPTGYYYIVAVKLNSNGSLDIVCPVDYNEKFTSLSALEEVYVSSYDVEGNGNWKTTCTAAGTSITVSDSSGYMSKCVFTSGNASFSMIGNSGMSEFDSVTPTRDKNKETGNTVLYLYNPLERQIYGADLNYCAVKNEAGTYYVYWYLYDEDEDENYTILEDMYPDDMPIVSADNLAKLKQMYQ
ncbi:MAG: hypothetical protein K6E69_00655 [Treponema sp.]|uniref:hypothetical protein n=1 Tax=Treponema sp. TaxID=166 RepID=UPI00298D8059|nr:hypothetical protein [Treponema sp.]MCR5385609.1 hypothetical protein [Treponema sp.]